MEDLSILCDCCKKDITYTHNCMDFRLELKDVQMPPKPNNNVVTLIYMHPSLQHNMHFCGSTCLKEWVREHL